MKYWLSTKHLLSIYTNAVLMTLWLICVWSGEHLSFYICFFPFDIIYKYFVNYTHIYSGLLLEKMTFNLSVVGSWEIYYVLVRQKLHVIIQKDSILHWRKSFFSFHTRPVRSSHCLLWSILATACYQIKVLDNRKNGLAYYIWTLHRVRTNTTAKLLGRNY